MIATICSATTIGYEGKIIEVECDTSNGLPNLLIVGLGNKAIDEARERVRSAIKNTQLTFPKKRITFNLAPANLPKHGAHFDLPIAIALLVVSGQLPQESTKGVLCAGELALDGSLRPITGATTYAELAKQAGKHTIIVPSTSAEQAALVPGVTVLPATSLRDVYLHLSGQQNLAPQPQTVVVPTTQTDNPIDDIRGQDQAKRALHIAAAGGHNVLFSGPPGAGKTMLAKALVSIMPPLTPPEIIDTTKLHSLAGENCERPITTRPFRSPHHSASYVALTGGGQAPRPGEISLAHHGVLFLDELPEYSRQSLEALRQPLEDRRITIARAQDTVSFPADFMLIATQNPCPCGFAGDPDKTCTCSPRQLQLYQKKLSGPLLDRIDMIVEVSRVDPEKLLTLQHKGDQTQQMRESVARSRARQAQRFSDPSRTNATMTAKEVSQIARLEPQARNLLEQAASAMHLSARSYFKTIKVARTIADIECSESITPAHISEALQYRPRNTF